MMSSIEKALKKRALGYNATEITEEYANDGEEIKMIKRKVVSKNVPPDVSAVKLLFDLKNERESLVNLSDEELEKERQRLLNLLNKGD